MKKIMLLCCFLELGVLGCKNDPAPDKEHTVEKRETGTRADFDRTLKRMIQAVRKDSSITSIIPFLSENAVYSVTDGSEIPIRARGAEIDWSSKEVVTALSKGEVYWDVDYAHLWWKEDGGARYDFEWKPDKKGEWKVILIRRSLPIDFKKE